MRLMTVWAIAAVLFFVAGLSAQEKPNFSGEWTITTPDGPTGLCGQQCTITQDASSLTMLTGGQAKRTFNLDGREHEDAQGQGLVVTKAMWDGNKLRISIQVPVSSAAGAFSKNIGQMELVFSMNAGQMEVVTSFSVSNGEVRRSKQTYKKN